MGVGIKEMDSMASLLVNSDGVTLIVKCETE